MWRNSAIYPGSLEAGRKKKTFDSRTRELAEVAERIGQARTAFEHWTNRGDSEQQIRSRSYHREQWKIKLILVVQF